MGVNAPFPVDPVLTGIAMSYRNARLIADRVLPRLNPPLEKEQFKYQKFTKEDGFTIPDTKVGRKSVPNEVEFTAEEIESSTEDYGLDDVIPNKDVDNASHDPIGHAAERLTELVHLDREKRVADTVFAAATYPTGNKKTISGTDQWSDTANSDPVVEISDALDVPLIRPNVMIIGRSPFTYLSRHPKIAKAVHGNSGDSGIANRRQIAELFELEEILVGESHFNTAKKGQTASYSRVWGKHCSLIHRDQLARNDDGRITFGYTAQFGAIVAGQMDEPKMGLRGSVRVRSGESVKEVIAAADLGYFLQNVIP